MLTILSITILAYCIMGKDIRALMKKVQNVDWCEMANDVLTRLQPYSMKVGRVAAKQILQFYYVMNDERTSTLDRLLIYGSIIYTITPFSLIPSAVYHFFGILDEGAALMFVYTKIQDNITPEINLKVEETLEDWFGASFEIVQ